MAPNSLSPASVVIDYHSAYAPHKMTICTREWFPTSVTGVLGSYAAWDSSTIDAQVMIEAIINKLKTQLKTNAAFDNITIYTQATASSPNIPRATLAISTVGVLTTGDEAAVSRTYNFKTSGNGNARLELLDSVIPATWFNRILPAGFGADDDDIVAEFTASTNAWSGRDDNQPTVCRGITMDLNDKLQRMYFK